MATPELQHSFQTLLQTEENFRSLVENVQDCAIYMLDPFGHVISWNVGAEKIMGYKAPEVIGRHFSCFFIKEDIEQGLPERELEIAKITGRVELEGWRLRADGSRFWASVVVTSLRGEHGELRGFVKIIQKKNTAKEAEEALKIANESQEMQIDQRTAVLKNIIKQLLQQIRERQKIETQLRDSEQRFRAIFDQAAVGISQVGLDGRWLMVNQRLCDIVGYSASELLQSKFQDITHPDDIAADCEYKRQLLAGEISSYSMEKRYIRKDGSIVWVNLSVSLVSDTSPIKNQDSTDSLHYLQSVPKYFISVIEDISDRKAAEQALAESEAKLRKQATQLKNALQQLKRTQLQLIHSEKMSSLGQLVAGIAHEINNPVSFIYGNLDYAAHYITDLLHLVKLYQQQYPATPTIQEFQDKIDLDFLREDALKLLSSMKQGAERISQIVLSLRNFSRHDEALLKEVDIHSGIESTLMILRHRLQPKPGFPAIQVIKDFGNLPKVQCYASQLNQVFMNILSNAIDALEERYITSNICSMPCAQCPTIHIRTELLDGERVAIYIADNGPGMTEEVRARLFDPFFTTKSVSRGLGLSISYYIVVEQHGGELTCFSQPGKGAHFAIVIPLRQK
ncbi:MAG: PAS domain S-box protein [Oscillatoriaceae bacterium SKW80]|nr:PAS domain S-box protein [Oscillatoriaceae bacterium SKYG93]MCX8122127.1 PAS domain S-box protein [Oscillatoriaceae bacterium SKW80]MDW8454414.1 PAS domain S-box protein [Oscillatoriaceae cyanobacterium SKYGB_i_bin93]HIK29278.1 PAS domain S-box protein [Oscillatoriaceae cyanobacterium M7585_C2015_266]